MTEFCVQRVQKKHYNAIATLLNESDEGWPGGLVYGNPFNEERILRRYNNREVVAALVGMEKDRAVCLLEIEPYFKERDAAYVAFLNAHPSCHGKGYGRKTLQEAVEVALKEGYSRLDLYTWAGNIKAVPAYKKTGFFWYPSTSVYMQNFLPQILSCPLLKDFFTRNDWYETFSRPVDIAEDFYLENERRVFVYRWNGDVTLEVAVDVLDSRMFRFVLDGEEYSVTTDGEELYLGYPKDFCIKAPRGMEIVVEAEEGYLLEKTTIRTTTGAPRKNMNDRSHSMKVTMKHPSGDVKLGLGFLSRFPIEVEFSPNPAVIPPSKTATPLVKTYNPMKKEVRYNLQLVSDNVHVVPKELSGCLGPLERKGERVGIEATPNSRIKTIIAVENGPTYERDIPLLCPGRLMPDALIHDDHLYASDGRYLLEIYLKEGGVTGILDLKDRGLLLGNFLEDFGPPFNPGHLRAKPYHASVLFTEDGTRILLATEADKFGKIR
ncbi:MAG TPA: GNAT family N-acetyltransferase, partial [Euryarchaeota archaeon]|nr:GNAT family N-acetyltransferase [Euryarchaeota archaeon]